MTLADVKELIARKVNSLNGVKATALAGDPEVIEACLAVEKATQQEVDVVRLLDEMAQAGELVEVEYILPEMTYRLKSMYLPKGSEVFTNTTNETLTKIKEALESAEDYDVVFYIAKLVGANVKGP
jgi:hypothetical protein